MRYWIALNFKHLSMKINWAKNIFHWAKCNFEQSKNSAHTTKCLALGNALLGRLYLYLKV